MPRVTRAKLQQLRVKRITRQPFGQSPAIRVLHKASIKAAGCCIALLEASLYLRPPELAKLTQLLQKQQATDKAIAALTRRVQDQVIEGRVDNLLRRGHADSPGDTSTTTTISPPVRRLNTIIQCIPAKKATTPKRSSKRLSNKKSPSQRRCKLSTEPRGKSSQQQ